MANFIFDPTPFLPAGCQVIEAQGRPARMRIIHGAMEALNEDLAIATIIPMPAGEVDFLTVRDILAEFLHSRRIGFTSITRCPFGQAYVRFTSIFERDHYINSSPHTIEDINLIFQKHNEGLN